MMDGNTLMTRVGGGADQVNLMEIVSYLRESKLARKVSGFAESQAELAIKKGESHTFAQYRVKLDLVADLGQRVRDHARLLLNTPRSLRSTSSNRSSSLLLMRKKTAGSYSPSNRLSHHAQTKNHTRKYKCKRKHKR